MIELKSVIDENEAILLRYYNSSLRQLKKLIIECALKGNDTTHLKAVKRNIEYEIKILNQKFCLYSTENIAGVYKSGIRSQEERYKLYSIPFEPVHFGGLHKEALKVVAFNTYKPLGRIVEIIGRNCNEYLSRTNFKKAQSTLKGISKFIADSKDLRKIGIAASGRIVRGDSSWQNAVKKVKDEFAAKDIFCVPYYRKNGNFSHFVQMKDYAKLVARTTSAEAYRTGAQNSILETFEDEGDLVQIIGQSQYPDSPCIPYQKKILSLKGITKGYTTIDEAKAQGLFHPNCIHHFAVTNDVLDEYEKLEKN